MIEVWLEIKVNRAKLYHMMPISAKKSFLGTLRKGLNWLDITSEIKEWINYVEKYRSMGHDFSDDQVIDTLVGNRPTEEVVFVLHWLRYFGDMKVRADLLQQKLTLKASSTTNTMQLMIRLWLETRVSPAEVYHMMPVSSERSSLDAINDETRWEVVRDKIASWLSYAYQYQEKGYGFSDDQVIEVLLSNR